MTADAPFPADGHGRDSEPAHSGLRPLSPYGEGYCRRCSFVVGLTSSGHLVSHTRMASAHSSTRDVCPGTDTRPPKATPYASRKAAFRLKPRLAQCPECRRLVELRHTDEGFVLYVLHGERAGRLLPSCPKSLRSVEP